MIAASPETHSNSLPREERLRGRSAVSRLFVDSESGFAFPIRYVWREGDSEVDSVLFTVPKRFHKRANRRNLLRRRMKEAYRLQKLPIPEGAKGLNIALIYSSKEQMDYAHIAKSVAKAIAQIAKESGRIVEPEEDETVR